MRDSKNTRGIFLLQRCSVGFSNEILLSSHVMCLDLMIEHEYLVMVKDV